MAGSEIKLKDEWLETTIGIVNTACEPLEKDKDHYLMQVKGETQEYAVDTEFADHFLASIDGLEKSIALILDQGRIYVDSVQNVKIQLGQAESDAEKSAKESATEVG